MNNDRLSTSGMTLVPNINILLFAKLITRRDLFQSFVRCITHIRIRHKLLDHRVFSPYPVFVFLLTRYTFPSSLIGYYSSEDIRFQDATNKYVLFIQK